MSAAEARLRVSSAAGVVVGLLGLAMTLPFAAAYHVAYGRGEGERASILTSRLEDSLLLGFSAPEAAYRSYGRAFFVVLAAATLILYAFSRAEGARPSRLARAAWRTLLAGLALALVGVFTDYWVETPPGFVAVLLAWLVLAAALSGGAVALARAGAIPVSAAVCLAAALPLSGAVAVTLVPHVPSGPLVGLHAVVLAAGAALWRGGRLGT